jgi:hypothetical protein
MSGEHDPAVAAERLAVSEIKRLAEAMKPHLPWVWRWGDGDGGWVLDVLKQHLPDFAEREAAETAKLEEYRKRQISRQIRTAVFERDAYRCQHCGGHKDLTVDHIFPEVAGGTLDPDNLQTLCRPCNSRKGASLPDDDL